jgi:hypothetical protein
VVYQLFLKKMHKCVKISAGNFSFNMDRPRCSSLPPELNIPTSSHISRRSNSASELHFVDEQNEEGTGYASADDQSLYSSACSGSQTISAAIQSSIDETIDNSDINQ